jgi:hypothetical protein
MADALEQGRPSDAVQAGKEALKALEDAQRTGDNAAEWDLREQSAGRSAENARERIARELEWAEEAVDKLRRSATNRAKGELEKSGKREGQLAEKAHKLAEEGESGDGSLPDETLELLDQAERAMQEATKALEKGDGITGSEQQKNAQRLLEMARNGDDDDDKESRSDGRPRRDHLGDGKEMAKKGKVPGKEEHKGPDAFRKRVLEGLSRSSDPLLKDAVKRYTEGLLR